MYHEYMQLCRLLKAVMDKLDGIEEKIASTGANVTINWNTGTEDDEEEEEDSDDTSSESSDESTQSAQSAPF